MTATGALVDLGTAAPAVYSVSDLNRETRTLLNRHFGLVWVEGEVSNLTIPSSGHCYFSLRDAEAQIRCALFRSQTRTLTALPQNGDQVLLRAQVSLYEPRGDYQLIVDYLEPIGDGLLRRAFEILKQRLAAEGLFDPSRKKPMPALPRCIGLITSPTGAAIHDVLTVLRRRFPAIPVIVFPAKVQGADAPREIVDAIQAADRSGLCDVLLLVRGGGSLEDLWAFNDESVARAIDRCEMPLVTGIGHEIDFTIADWVADLRAPTPSAAAEAVSPDAKEWRRKFQQRERELTHRMIGLLHGRVNQLAFVDKRLQQSHPRTRIQTRLQRIDELELRLRRAIRLRIGHGASRVETQIHRLLRHHPGSSVMLLESRRTGLEKHLQRALIHRLEGRRSALVALRERLNTVSPLATLARGYAAVTRQCDGGLVRSSADVATGEMTLTRLAEGSLLSRVEEVFAQPAASEGR